MKRLGAILVVLGVGSFILPLIGMQFRILSAIDPHAQPLLGGALAVGGVLLLVLGMATTRRARSLPPMMPPVSLPPPLPGQIAPPGVALAGGSVLPPQAPSVAGRRHWPWVALICAILIPGAGQAYNGRPIKGFFLLFFSLLILPWIYSLYDAWAGAKRMATAGGRFGKGGLLWVFLQGWLAFNVALLASIILTATGVLQ